MSAQPQIQRARSFPAGVRHGFTTRHGGVSSGPFATLNLGAKWGDASAAVSENLRRVADAGGFSVDRLVRVRQVHGAKVVRAADVCAGTEADAVWHRRGDDAARDAQTAVGVLTADCVPVLLASDDGDVVAAIHSGWRGTVADVVGSTVAHLRAEAGVAPQSLWAAIGPCIEAAAFEVGEEVAAQFPGEHVGRPSGGRPHVDLVARVRSQLAAAGIDPHRVERVGSCTHRNPDMYFSYRRDGAGTGQHLAFVGTK